MLEQGLASELPLNQAQDLGRRQNYRSLLLVVRIHNSGIWLMKERKNKAQARGKLRRKAGPPGKRFKREPWPRRSPAARLGQTRQNRESCGPAATPPC